MSDAELFAADAAAAWTLADGAIAVNGVPLLTGLPPTVSLIPDPNGVGVFVCGTAEMSSARIVFPLGELTNITRLTCAHRYEPFWMTARAGTRASDVPPETQFLLCERADGEAVLFAPILDGDFRASLQGNGENGLELVAESGDPAVCASRCVGLFLAAHADPYTLMAQSAQSVMARMQTGTLRRDKPLPDFVNQFGWCTWDAFYQDVSHDKVREGLESFAHGGVKPRFVILDDGWQSVRKRESGEKRLTAFAANEKFPNGLAPTVGMAKSEFGVQTFLVWHALNGYWGGADEETLPDYAIRPTPRSFSPGILHHRPMLNTQWWGEVVGLVSGRDIYRFYHDYHRHLRLQGVDGVKVDTQCTLEGIAAGEGGRVRLMRRYHEALEGSVSTHFGGNLVNCMSCSTDMLFSALNSTITRTSTDFWPNKPESHGEHLYVNALVSLWFGEFVHPDWDMFQSGHAMGAFHAMGRAVSGGPIYVSDKPDAHDFDILRKLALPNGAILRSHDPGRATRDCLFHDPTREDVLLKIFNRNDGGYERGVIGVFNARYHAPNTSQNAAAKENEAEVPLSEAAEPNANVQEAETIGGYVSPADLAWLRAARCAVYRHATGECRIMEHKEQWQIELPALTGDVFTVAAVRDGFAPIGLADMYNSGAAVIACEQLEATGERARLTVWVEGGGRFLAWSETRPAQVRIKDATVPYTYSEDTHLLEFALQPDYPACICIKWENQSR